MNKVLFLIIMLLSFSIFPVLAEIKQNTQRSISNSYNGALAITSDYVPRGITQSNEKPALQGKFLYSNSSGFYSSITGVTVEFNDHNEAKVETDLEAGYQKNIYGIDFSLSGVGYVYPGANTNLNYNFFETKFRASKKFKYATLAGAIHYSPNYFMDSGNAFYTPVFLIVPIKSGVSLIADGSHQIVSDNKHFTIPDYWHWSVGLSYDIKKFNLSLKYIDTDLRKIECPDGCEPRIVATLIRYF